MVWGSLGGWREREAREGGVRREKRGEKRRKEEREEREE